MHTSHPCMRTCMHAHAHTHAHMQKKARPECFQRLTTMKPCSVYEGDTCQPHVFCYCCRHIGPPHKVLPHCGTLHMAPYICRQEALARMRRPYHAPFVGENIKLSAISSGISWRILESVLSVVTSARSALTARVMWKDTSHENTQTVSKALHGRWLIHFKLLDLKARNKKTQVQTGRVPS